MRYLKLWFIVIAGLALLCCGCEKKSTESTEETESPEFVQGKTTAESTVSTYQQLLEDTTAQAARAMLVDSLAATAGVTAAGLSSDSITIWWESTDGVEYCLFTETRASLTDTSGQQGFFPGPNPKMPSSAAILELPHNNSALILSPYQWDWNLLGLLPLQDETQYINDVLQSINYNTTFKVNATQSQQNISMSDYENFDDYGVIAFSTHGGVNHADQVIIATGVIATSELYLEYYEDLQNKNLTLVVYIDKWFTSNDILAFAFTPGWIQEHYPQKLDSTLFYASACKSLFNNTMSNAVVGSGAAYFGWDESVGTGQATETGKDLFAQLAVNALDCGAAQQEVVNNGNAAYEPPEWSTEPTAHFSYVGDDSLYLVEEPVRIAVSPDYWDDIGALLSSFGYDVSLIQLDQLSDSAATAQYDIIALNCAPGLSEYASSAAQNLANFVYDGGKLYASDWAYIFVESAFASYIDFPDIPYIGDDQTTTATVNDPELAQYLGVGTVDITYDLGAWVVIDGVGSSTNVLLTGDVTTSGGGAGGLPPLDRKTFQRSPNSVSEVRTLAVSFSYGSGTVVYTTFHNEAQITEPSRHILEYFTILE